MSAAGQSRFRNRHRNYCDGADWHSGKLDSLVGLYELHDKTCRCEKQEQLLFRGDRHGTDYGGHAA